VRKTSVTTTAIAPMSSPTAPIAFQFTVFLQIQAEETAYRSVELISAVGV
jgi:hypothetical protein